MNLFLVGILFALSPVTVFSQDWDYENYPLNEIDFNHLDAEIRISDTGNIEGDLLYHAIFKNSFTDSLLFDASGLDVRSVLVNQQESEFRIYNDKLVVYLQNKTEYERGDEIKINILYRANPNFGILKNENGTVWTSSLPLSNRHWIPVVDHPGVYFTTDIVYTYPAGMTLVANGRSGSSDVISVEEEQVTFSSNIPVAASSLGWAFGEFPVVLSTVSSQNILGAQYSLFSRRTSPQIYIYSELENDYSELLNVAAGTFHEIANFTDKNYPFRDLHIVILSNSYWEIKQYGSGIVYVYKDRGSLEDQVVQGILSQWIGEWIRGQKWSDSDAIFLMQAFVEHSLFELDYEGEDPVQPYSQYSAYNKSLWESFVEHEASPVLLSGLERVLGTLLKQNQVILNWNMFAGLLYEETGIPWFDGFSPVLSREEEDVSADYVYNVVIEWEDGSDLAQVFFEAENRESDELVTVDAEIITFNDSRSQELTFTGDSEGVVLNVPRMLENINLTVRDRDDVTLKVQKPFIFWLYQLRNSESVRKRAEAASGLADYSENPDLQLALNDLLRDEPSPVVYAEILRSMSAITKGASGTEEQFMRNTGQNQHFEVRLAAVESLGKFKNNERVIAHLNTFITQAANEELKTAAIRSFAEITEPGRFSRSVENFVTRESLLYQVPLLLKLVAEKGEQERAVELADDFIDQGYPYVVRKGSLDLLLELDQSPGNWNQRLPVLMEDAHPKIRYTAAEAIARAGQSVRREIVDSILMREFDARVINSILRYSVD